MSPHKHLAPFLIAVIAVTGVFTYARHARITPPPVNAPVAATSSAVQGVPSAATAVRPVRTAGAATAPAVTGAAATVPNAMLAVGTTTYPISVTPSETVVDAMRALATTDTTFTFTGRDYPSLGFFIDSINGKGNAGGLYWMLYVNGVSASAGASSVVVNPGDTVAWKYEKGY